MAITKESVIDQITVVDSGEVLYRTATKIMEDGVELSKTFHRSSLYPGQDTTDRPANVVAICNTVWTPEIIAAYKAKQEALITKATQQTQGA
jgi:hypothetical protein